MLERSQKKEENEIVVMHTVCILLICFVAESEGLVVNQTSKTNLEERVSATSCFGSAQSGHPVT